MDPIHELLSRVNTIAVVGLSDSPLRPSHGVSAYMQLQGYKIIPVNPEIAESLGRSRIRRCSRFRAKWRRRSTC